MPDTQENSTADARYSSTGSCPWCPHDPNVVHGTEAREAEQKEALTEWDAIPGTGGFTFEGLSHAEQRAALDRMDEWQERYRHIGLTYSAHCGGAWAYLNDEWVEGH